MFNRAVSEGMFKLLYARLTPTKFDLRAGEIKKAALEQTKVRRGAVVAQGPVRVPVASPGTLGAPCHRENHCTIRDRPVRHGAAYTEWDRPEKRRKKTTQQRSHR